jgi:hypothetical protein
LHPNLMSIPSDIDGTMNLKYLTARHDIVKRQMRWSEMLSNFSFILVFRKGRESRRADALSRVVELDGAQDFIYIRRFMESKPTIKSSGLSLETSAHDVRSCQWVLLGLLRFFCASRRGARVSPQRHTLLAVNLVALRLTVIPCTLTFSQTAPYHQKNNSLNFGPKLCTNL